MVGFLLILKVATRVSRTFSDSVIISLAAPFLMLLQPRVNVGEAFVLHVTGGFDQGDPSLSRGSKASSTF